jgi:hypothetical protein
LFSEYLDGLYALIPKSRTNGDHAFLVYGQHLGAGKTATSMLPWALGAVERRDDITSCISLADPNSRFVFIREAQTAQGPAKLEERVSFLDEGGRYHTKTTAHTTSGFSLTMMR